MKIFQLKLVVLCIVVLFSAATALAGEPRQIILTWEDDPMTTMTITWRTEHKGDSVVRFSPVEERLEQEWKQVEARTFTFDETKAWIHTAKLTGLNPGAEYTAVVVTAGVAAEEFSFRTAPAESREVVFVAGGDSRTNRELRREINAGAAGEDPDFVMFNGDLVEGPLSEEEWDDWFDDWHDLMITEDQRRIPLLPAMGNHEVEGFFDGEKKDAPFYYHRFMLPEPEKYYAVEFGPDLVLLTLDSGHTSDIDGEQLVWLKETLKQYEDRYLIVQYHVPAWPSGLGEFFGRLSREIRKHWVPLFEEYGVRLAIAAHEHTYKRTPPLLLHHRDEDERELIKDAVNRATRSFDRNKDYSPEANPELQKLAAGEWEEAGYDSHFEALQDLCLQMALYGVQLRKFSVNDVYELVNNTALYRDYWGRICEENGVVYMGDGGWGAPLRQEKNADAYWWLEETTSLNHYFKVILQPEEEKLEVIPVFFHGDKWEEGDAILLSS